MCNNDNIKIFTDASFDPKSKTAIMGYMMDGVITTQIITGTTNTEAELCAILWAITFLNTSSRYILYTDCKTAVDLQHIPRYTKPIYTDLLKKLEVYPNLELKHLEGHKRSSEKTDLDKEFSILDKYVREQLRAIR